MVYVAEWDMVRYHMHCIGGWRQVSFIAIVVVGFDRVSSDSGCVVGTVFVGKIEPNIDCVEVDIKVEVRV